MNRLQEVALISGGTTGIGFALAHSSFLPGAKVRIDGSLTLNQFESAINPN